MGETNELGAFPMRAARRQVATLEALWEREGGTLRRLVHRYLDDDGLGDDERTVDAACYAVMLRAGRYLDEARVPALTAQTSWWLRRTCVEVCRDIRRHGVDPAWLDRGPLPRSLPTRLRQAVRFRALSQALRLVEAARSEEGPITRARRHDRARWRAAFERHLRGLPALVLLPRLARSLTEAATRLLRDAYRRGEQAMVAGSSSAQRVTTLLGGGGAWPDAAALVTAVVAVGVVPATAPPPTSPEPPVVVAAPVSTPIVAIDRARAVPAPEPEPAPPPPVPEPAPPPEPEPEDEVTTPTEPALQPEPTDDQAEPRTRDVEKPPKPDPAPELPEEPSPDARVEADPGETSEEPVKDKDWENESGTIYYVTPGVDASADVDEDGEDDVTVTSSETGWSCAPPGEHGVTGSAVCPVLEESGMPSQPSKG